MGRGKKLAKDLAASHLLENLISIQPGGFQEFAERIRLHSAAPTQSPFAGPVVGRSLTDGLHRCAQISAHMSSCDIHV